MIGPGRQSASIRSVGADDEQAVATGEHQLRAKSELNVTILGPWTKP